MKQVSSRRFHVGITIMLLKMVTGDFNAKEQIRLQEQLLASDRASIHNQNDHAWNSFGPVTAAEESGVHGEDYEVIVHLQSQST